MSADREVVAKGAEDEAPPVAVASSAVAMPAASGEAAVTATPVVSEAALQPSTSHALVAVAAPATSIPLDPHAAGTHSLCANCEATLTDRFCASCGQRVEHAVQSLRHFISEATEDLTHADSRLWLTIGALLFKPGFLTTEFLAGRRVRYLPPIRLYLVMSVVFFVLLAVSPGNHLTKEKRAQIAQKTGQQLPADADDDDDDNKVAASTSDADEDKATDKINATIPATAAERDRIRAKCARIGVEISGDVTQGWLQSGLQRFVNSGCLGVSEDRGHALGEIFLHNLPKALLATLPVMAAIMKLLYWRPRRYYVEHMLFLLHNYAFIFLWLAVFVLLGIITWGWVKGVLYFILLLYPVWYYWVAMRRVYPQGWVRTTLKYNVLLFGYTCVASIALTLDVIYAALVR